MLGTAESCTGGGVAHACTELAGSSQWFAGGVVTYSNALKQKLLGVPLATLEKEGAVSELTAIAMARGALPLLNVDYALAITGIAGPGGGSPQKPVGTVCFAWSGSDSLQYSECCLFTGDRREIREQSVIHALSKLNEIL
ncbi:damage-inducible protein CinA [Aliidiomarina minuta]|uniref:Damage-inducible protein CinA n=2 Tax=Aliidiomarina minuta TaxID=880057 RepID=A0A432WAT7_9GAMM|nr:damage-inducible protein CinA [Aliidiomarina minuta]